MGAVVDVFAFFVFVFAACVFFVFSVFVVSWAPVAAANTGIANANTIIKLNNTVKSFFMLGLDLLMNFFHLWMEQGNGHFSAITPDRSKQLNYQKLQVPDESGA